MSDTNATTTLEQAETMDTVLSGGLDAMLDQLRYHEERAAAIRASLRALRAKLTRHGGRAGVTPAKRGGRRRRTATPDTATDGAAVQ